MRLLTACMLGRHSATRPWLRSLRVSPLRHRSQSKRKPSKLSGFSFARKTCFWCRLRMTGKKDEEDRDDVMQPESGPAGSPRSGGLVGFRVTELECNEDCTILRIPVARTHGSKGAVEIEIATSDGTANEVVDYKAPITNRLRWEDGEAGDKFIEIEIVNDDFTNEGDETFHVSIESLVDGDVGIGNSRCTVTIKDVVVRDKGVSNVWITSSPFPTLFLPFWNVRADTVIFANHTLLAAAVQAEPAGALSPTKLAWKEGGFRAMKVPRSWMTLLGKNKVDVCCFPCGFSGMWWTRLVLKPKRLYRGLANAGGEDDVSRQVQEAHNADVQLKTRSRLGG